MASTQPFTTICRYCNLPVALDTAKTDENGRAVHEDCYAAKNDPGPEETPATRILTFDRHDATEIEKPRLASELRRSALDTQSRPIPAVMIE